MMEQLADERRQRPVDDPERVAIAERPIRPPTRQPDAVLHRFVVLEDEIGVVPGVVRAPEVAGLEQRRNDDEAEEEDQREIDE